MKIDFEKIAAVAFLAVIFAGAGFNEYRNKGQLSKSLSGMTLNGAQKQFAAAAETFKTNFAGRSKLIDLYGISLNAMGKKVVGNFEFIKDKNGNMQNITIDYNYDTFFDSMTELKKSVGNADLFFVNIPSAAGHDAVPIDNWFSFQNPDRTEICGRLTNADISVLDLSDNFDASNYYFKTDVHPKTESEFKAAQYIYNRLADDGIDVRDGERIFDINNYTVSQREFIGNLSRSSGRFYAGSDIFEYYIPNFETSYQLLVYSSGLFKTGTWEDVILNHKFPQENIYNYYVTDYVQWPSPAYTIRNDLTASNAKVLFIADSMALRTISYLSLSVNELTVADPRYSTNQEYIKCLLANNSYDAVIVCAASPAFINTPFSSYFSEADISGYTTLPAQTSDEWIGSNGMWIEDQAEGNTISLSKAKSYMDMLQISGWAADFESDTPLTDLIAEVNGKKYRCSYGFEKKGVADKFGDGLLRTGFTLWIPDGISAGDKITFTMVNSGTQAVYEPVTYEFTE